MSRKKHKKKKKKKDFSDRPSSRQRFIMNILFVISCVICGGLPFIYRYIQGQYLILNKPDVILFLTEEKMITFPFIFVSMIIIFIYLENFRYEKFELRKKWKTYSIIFIVLIGSLIIPLSFINSRYDILENGIYKYSFVGKKTSSYSWDEVSEAKAFISYHNSYKGSGDYYFEYSIKLNDGKVLELVYDGQSKDIWHSLSLIDNILKRNHIKIYRDKSNLYRLEKDEKDYREKVERFIY